MTTLQIPHTTGECNCCGTRDNVRHQDDDLGFVCTDCYVQLVMAEIALRQMTAAQDIERREG